MRVIERSPPRLVAVHCWRSGLWGIAALLVCVCFFLALDSKHPKATLVCTRHPVIYAPGPTGQVTADTEDIDCDLEIRPPQGPLNFIQLHQEIRSSFELSGVHLARLHPLSSCKLVCDPETEYKCRCEQKPEAEPPPQALTADVDTLAALPSTAAQEPEQLTLVLEDNQGTGHVYYAFTRPSEAHAAYAEVDSFLHRARGESADANDAGTGPALNMPDLEGNLTMLNDGSAAAQDDARRQLDLSVAHDSSWLDEAGTLLFGILALWLMLQPVSEKVTLDATAGVLEVQRWNAFNWCTSHHTCALEHIAKVEVVRYSSSTATAAAAATASLPFARNDVLTVPDSTSSKYVMRVSLSGFPNGGSVGRPAALPDPSTSSTIDLALAQQCRDNAAYERIAEAANDLLQRYAISEMHAAAEAAATATEHSGAPLLCCVCTSRKARVVLFPCKHLVLCPQCSSGLQACPMCRSEVRERHTVYL